MHSSSTIQNGSNKMPLNLYTIFVGPPATKSQALKDCALKPMSALQDDQDLGDVIIQKCTSSGLVKTISQQGKGFLLSAEIYDMLHKLLKSDEESATGDVQVMCDGCFLASEFHIVTPQKRLEKSQRTLPSPSLAQLRFHLLRGSFPNLTRVTACYFASCSPFRSA